MCARMKANRELGIVFSTSGNTYRKKEPLSLFVSLDRKVIPTLITTVNTETDYEAAVQQ